MAFFALKIFAICIVLVTVAILATCIILIVTFCFAYYKLSTEIDLIKEVIIGKTKVKKETDCQSDDLAIEYSTIRQLENTPDDVMLNGLVLIKCKEP